MPNVEEFQIITHRKGRKKLKSKIGQPVLQYFISEENITTDDLARSVLAAAVNFTKSPFNQIIFNGLSKSLNALNFDAIGEVICYGLGNFSQSRASKYQLSSLLTIKNRFNCNVLVYDPVFTKTEVQVLKTLKLNIININEEGKHVIAAKPTLIFMPHCPSQLLNNFLYCNWGTQLKNCIFLCNSWSEVFDQNPLSYLKNETNYILRIYPYVVENKLENKFEFVEPFSGTSVHILPDLCEISLNFWHPHEEPIYPTDNSDFLATNFSSHS